MNMQMCRNGHFYDADTQPECPHCEREAAAGTQFPKTGIVTDFPSTGCYMKNHMQPEAPTEFPKTAPVGSAPQEFPKTAPVGSTPLEFPKTAPVGSTPLEFPKTAPVGSTPLEFPKTAPVGSARMEFPKTAPVGGAPREFPKTAPVGGAEPAPPAMGWNPVLGWLVCVEGRKRGKDYRLTQEVNYIGRATSNDICLDYDEEISRDTTITIAYIKQSRVFRLDAEQSRDPVYVNGQPVLSELYLRDKDVISVGSTRLKLICFCDASFEWEN